MKLKHALTKEGAIMAITRKQVAKLSDGEAPRGILKSFIDLYMEQQNERIMETYRQEVGKELVIGEYK